ncbi:efflux RND transporter periplasmic adaptor subunit [Halomonas sp. E14]|uniref:efflux RND transporter periplasmic adaptor subunit n=1 Tax=Halomonas sp. E14 TaxID=3397245 RepID=UPI00403E6209
MSCISRQPSLPLPRHRRWRWVFLLAWLPWLSGCEAPPVEEEPLRPVRTLLVEESVMQVQREIPGRLEAMANRRVSFRVAGRLDALHVVTGDLVSPGQRLASLDAADLVLQRDRAAAALAAAEAGAANAESEWQRARRLYEAGSVAARELDAARAQVEAARSQRRSAGDALALAQRQLDFAQLESPGACRVAQRLAESGENLAAGQPLLVLACGEGLEVRASLSEDMLDRLAPGDEVTVRLPLHALELTGRVREIGVPVDSRQATWPLRVSLEGLGEAELASLRPGMAAELSLPRQRAAEAAIWVPMLAVQRDARGTFVFVAEPTAEVPNGNGREAVIRRVDVTLGERHGDTLQVSQGLVAGMALVIAGMSRIQEGQRVRLQDVPRENSP